jgi:hypothetical protein
MWRNYILRKRFIRQGLEYTSGHRNENRSAAGGQDGQLRSLRAYGADTFLCTKTDKIIEITRILGRRI